MARTPHQRTRSRVAHPAPPSRSRRRARLTRRRRRRRPAPAAPPRRRRPPRPTPPSAGAAAAPLLGGGRSGSAAATRAAATRSGCTCFSSVAGRAAAAPPPLGVELGLHRARRGGGGARDARRRRASYCGGRRPQVGLLRLGELQPQSRWRVQHARPSPLRGPARMRTLALRRRRRRRLELLRGACGGEFSPGAVSLARSLPSARARAAGSGAGQGRRSVPRVFGRARRARAPQRCWFCRRGAGAGSDSAASRRQQRPRAAGSRSSML